MASDERGDSGPEIVLMAAGAHTSIDAAPRALRRLPFASDGPDLSLCSMAASRRQFSITAMFIDEKA